MIYFVGTECNSARSLRQEYTGCECRYPGHLGYRKGGIDPVTKEKITRRTANMATLVYLVFKNITDEKGFRDNIRIEMNHFVNSLINPIKSSISRMH